MKGYTQSARQQPVLEGLERYSQPFQKLLKITPTTRA